MSIPEVLQALATTESKVDALKKTYVYPPESLQRGNLPAAINLPTNARHSKVADGLKAEERDYVILVAVSRRGTKRADEIVEDVVELIDTFIDVLESAPKLGGTCEDVEQAVVVSDSGVVTFEYEGGSDRYMGFEVTVTVTTKRTITVSA